MFMRGLVNMHKMQIKAIAFSVIFGASSLLFSQTAFEVVTTYKNLPCPNYSTANLVLEQIAPNGQITERNEVKQYGKIYRNDTINTVFEWESPASRKNTRVLQAEKIGKTDDSMIYTPDLRQVRRISTAARKNSVVGSELTFNDLRIREVEDDTHEMLKESDTITVSSGTTYTCWQIKSTPIKKSEVEYSYRITWFDKQTYLPVQVKYYDRKTRELFKTFEIEKIDHVKGTTGHEYVLRRSCYITNEKTGRKTHIFVKDFIFDAPNVNDSYFTQGWLLTGKAR